MESLREIEFSVKMQNMWVPGKATLAGGFLGSAEVPAESAEVFLEK